MADRKLGVAITNDIYFASQPDAESLKQAKDQKGFASVLNLRDGDEQTFVKDEADLVNGLNMQYKHIPIKSLGEFKNSATQVMEAIESMPKPVLVHCMQGQRAAVGGLLLEAKKKNMTYDQILEWGKSHDFHFQTHEALAAFLKEYSESYHKN